MNWEILAEKSTGQVAWCAVETPARKTVITDGPFAETKELLASFWPTTIDGQREQTGA